MVAAVATKYAKDPFNNSSWSPLTNCLDGNIFPDALHRYFSPKISKSSKAFLIF